MGVLLQVEGLHTHFFTKEGVIRAVNDVSFELEEETVLALVGESGGGKSTLGLSLLGLVPRPGKIVSGGVYLGESNLLTLKESSLRKLRGKDISIIFQDPRASLNPVLPIGVQIEEIFLAHTNLSRRAARRMAIQMLEETGMPDPKAVLDRYPFQLSGGMCQRAMLSIALALKPRVLVADEPTSSLDVTLQAEILKRLRELCQKYHSSILLITHDMGVVAQMAHEVMVMYAGRILEKASVHDLFTRPLHPYTWGLLQALPRLDQADRKLMPLRGNPPDMLNLPDQCPYIPRCPKAVNRCRLEPHPTLEKVEPGHWVSCYNTIRYD